MSFHFYPHTRSDNHNGHKRHDPFAHGSPKLQIQIVGAQVNKLQQYRETRFHYSFHLSNKSYLYTRQCCTFSYYSCYMVTSIINVIIDPINYFKVICSNFRFKTATEENCTFRATSLNCFPDIFLSCTLESQ